MKKIAVCIPSYNESHIISDTLRKVDQELIKYQSKGYEVIIINYDNDSPDKTSEIFKNTNTQCPKKSIINKKKGKGINLLKFFKYCHDNDIDYAITLDADVKSMKPNWITKFLEPLILEDYDYVTPIYKRSRYEGSTTNHFAYPIIYATTGYSIRQPIAGDFSFNKNFINTILKYPTCLETEKYGIDIFMTLIACYNNLKITQIKLDKKLHNPSYNKMENMFQEVLKSFLYTWSNLEFNPQLITNKNIENYDCIISSRKFSHKKKAKEMLDTYSQKISIKDIDIETLWIDKLYNLITNPNSIKEKELEEILNIFIIRATSFWLKSEKMSAANCELEIKQQTEKLLNKIKGEDDEKLNY